MKLRIAVAIAALWLALPASQAVASRFAIGYEHSCALTSSGGAKCWGRGMEGQLGYGGFTTYTTQPFTVVGLSGASAITSGYQHSCALFPNGRIKCWGMNAWG